MENSNTERLAKRIAAAGMCSRREAEELIEQGRVVVNGQVIESPAFNVSAKDTIHIDGEKLKDKPKVAKLWRYNKPAGLITATKDPRGRTSVFDVLPKQIGRVVSVGRLDLNSEGLLLFTNDGDLAQKLMLPSTGLKRVYKIRILGMPTPEKLKLIGRGIRIDGFQYGSIKSKPIPKKGEGKNVWLEVSLNEGKNREVRKVFEHIGHPVSRLIRLSYGPFELGTLKKGELVEVPFNTVQKFIKELEGKE